MKYPPGLLKLAAQQHNSTHGTVYLKTRFWVLGALPAGSCPSQYRSTHNQVVREDTKGLICI